MSEPTTAREALAAALETVQPPDPVYAEEAAAAANMTVGWDGWADAILAALAQSGWRLTDDSELVEAHRVISDKVQVMNAHLRGAHGFVKADSDATLVALREALGHTIWGEWLDDGVDRCQECGGAHPNHWENCSLHAALADTATAAQEAAARLREEGRLEAGVEVEGLPVRTIVWDENGKQLVDCIDRAAVLAILAARSEQSGNREEAEG